MSDIRQSDGLCAENAVFLPEGVSSPAKTRSCIFFFVFVVNKSGGWRPRSPARTFPGNASAPAQIQEQGKQAPSAAPLWVLPHPAAVLAGTPRFVSHWRHRANPTAGKATQLTAGPLRLGPVWEMTSRIVKTKRHIFPAGTVMKRRQKLPKTPPNRFAHGLPTRAQVSGTPARFISSPSGLRRHSCSPTPEGPGHVNHPIFCCFVAATSWSLTLRSFGSSFVKVCKQAGEP